MKRFVRVAWVSFLVSIAPTGCKPNPTPAERAVQKFECNRCHNSTKLPTLDDDDHCVNCHTAILDGKQDDEHPPAKLAEFKRNITGYPFTPTLNSVDRFRREWFVSYLLDPNDLRPALRGTMPNLPITRAEAELIATYFGVKDDKKTDANIGRVAEGEELFVTLGCGSCHTIGARRFRTGSIPDDVIVGDLSRAIQLAPDLQFTRDRLTVSTVRRWLIDPTRVKPDTSMPTYRLAESQIEPLVSFLFESEIETIERPEIPKRLPILKRTVTYSEVAIGVFRKVCWHCHAEPRILDGLDGGPGNVGGFGFPGKRLNFASYERVLEGGVDTNGERLDLFESIDGVPRIVRHMMARHSEVAGTPVEGVIGMPLGFPPMSLEQIQLVETWIVQGRKR